MSHARALSAGALIATLAACGGTVGAVSGASSSSGSGSTSTGGAAGTSSGGGLGGSGTTSASTGGSAGAGGSPGKGCGMAAAPGLHDETLQIGGMARTFHVHVPTGYDLHKPSMVVFVFHGFTEHGAGGDALSIEYLSQMDAVADAKGFLVVYPDGYQNSWNAGKCCGGALAANVDDLGFFDAMLARVEAEYCVDERRVFAAGLSNGAFFSDLLGCERAGVVAAIGPVAGPLDVASCTPSRPVPVFEVHGTADPVVFYGGGSVSGADSVPAAIAEWEKLDQCTDPAPQTVYTNGAASCTEEAMCSGGAAVELCVIQGGGHQWPGGKDDLIGAFSTDLDTSAKMVSFFEAHPLP